MEVICHFVVYNFISESSLFYCWMQQTDINESANTSILTLNRVSMTSTTATTPIHNIDHQIRIQMQERESSDNKLASLPTSCPASIFINADDDLCCTVIPLQ